MDDEESTTPKSTTPKSSFKNDRDGNVVEVEGFEADRLKTLDNWHPVKAGKG